MKNKSIDLTVRIAPKEGCGYWSVQDWQDAHDDNNWHTMYLIFRDRLNYRYFSAIQGLIDADARQPTRRFGFSIMALDCLLIETLAQFYLGLKTSDDARCENHHKLSNSDFYVNFLRWNSFKLRTIFDTERKAKLFYKTIRCGILHQGETTGGSKIVTQGKDIILETANSDGLVVNRDLFHRFLVDEEYKTYCDCLMADNLPEYRKNMIRKMCYICHIPVEDGDQQ